MHAEDGRLGRVNNWGSEETSENAAIRNGEGAPVHIFHRQLPSARQARQAGQLFFDLKKWGN